MYLPPFARPLDVRNGSVRPQNCAKIISYLGISSSHKKIQKRSQKTRIDKKIAEKEKKNRLKEIPRENKLSRATPKNHQDSPCSFPVKEVGKNPWIFHFGLFRPKRFVSSLCHNLTHFLHMGSWRTWTAVSHEVTTRLPTFSVTVPENIEFEPWVSKTVTFKNQNSSQVHECVFWTSHQKWTHCLFVFYFSWQLEKLRSRINHFSVWLENCPLKQTKQMSMSALMMFKSWKYV